MSACDRENPAVRRRRAVAAARPGFTLLEVMVVVVILGILATVLITQISGKIEIARREAAKAQIKQLESAVEEFKLFGKKYPEILQELVEKPGDFKGTWPDQGYLRGGEVPKDPWGYEYVYRKNSPGQTPRYEIISHGADGAEGGTGEDEDLSSYQPSKNK